MNIIRIRESKLNENQIIQFVRLLGELNACGLSNEQLDFLKESAELSNSDVSKLLNQADEIYEQFKDSVAFAGREV